MAHSFSLDEACGNLTPIPMDKASHTPEWPEKPKKVTCTRNEGLYMVYPHGRHKHMYPALDTRVSTSVIRPSLCGPSLPICPWPHSLNLPAFLPQCPDAYPCKVLPWSCLSFLRRREEVGRREEGRRQSTFPQSLLLYFWQKEQPIQLHGEPSCQWTSVAYRIPFVHWAPPVPRGENGLLQFLISTYLSTLNFFKNNSPY